MMNYDTYYKYYKSDFRLLVKVDTKYKGDDDSIVAIDTSTRFIFRFWTEDRNNPYVCSSTGGATPVLKNCTILDGTKVMCHFDRANMELGPGRLMLEAEFIIPDNDFTGNKENNVKRLYTTSMVLTTDPDKDSEGDHTFIPLLIDCLRGETGKNAYQYAVEHGYEGTEEEFAQEMKIVPEVAQEAKDRIDNFEGALTGSSPIYEFDEETEYGTGANQVNYCYKDGLLYKATTTHTGEWNASHFEEMNVLETMRLFSQVMLGLDEIPLFNTASSYSKDDYTIYEDKLYRFIENHSVGAWNANQVTETNVFNELIRLGEVANEKITVILSTEDGLGTVSGVSVSFTVEGESEPREIFTDTEGKASTIVTKGLLVDIDVAGIQGYETPDEVHVRASLPMRNVYVTYIVDRSAMYEHVRLTFSYADANNVNVATSIGVYYKDNDSDANPTLHTINVVNNVAEFDVPRGKEYTIVFPDVDVYRTPATISWTADHVSRQHTVLYVENNNGLSWVLNDGTEVPVNAVTQEDYDNIAGMLVYVSSCRPFIIPRDTPVAQRNWLSSNVGISTMGEFGNHSVALGDTDGEANCQKIADFCSGTSYTSGMVTYARTIQVEINGVPKVGFVAAYAQLWAMKTLYSQIRSYFAVVGLTFPNITSGSWWSSTQYNATYGVYLTNGNFGYNVKNFSNIGVLPVLAYD